MTDDEQDSQDPLGIRASSHRRTAGPSAAPADATRVGPGPVNPGAHQLTGIARVASDVFEHGIPYTPIPGADDFAHPLTGLVPKMLEQAGGSAAGPYVSKGLRGVLNLVKGAPRPSMGAVADLAFAAKGHPSALARSAGRLKGVADAVRSRMNRVRPAEGLQSPMESMSEAASQSVPEGRVLDAVKAQRSAPSVVEAVKAPRQSHRTQASFRDMAERMGEPPRPASLESMGLEGVENTPIAPRSKSALDAQLQEMWAKSKKLNPGEVGNTFGDAEEAMGLAPHQQPDLMALLRHSIIAKGGVPRVP